jgi:hypothetical protein
MMASDRELMNLRPVLVAALVAGWIVPFPSSALAGPVSDVDRATARSLAAEAHDALDRKEYAVAVDRFQRADALVHAPTFLLGIARAQVGLGAWIAAQESYARIVREGVPAGSPPPFFKALEEAKTELDALIPRVPYVTIRLKNSVAAKITIDGVEVPLAALGVKRPVDPGKHVVHVEAEGFTAVDRPIVAVEAHSDALDLELDLELRPASAPKRLDPPPATPPPVLAAPVTPPPVVAPPAPEPSPPSSIRRPLGVAAAGVGALGLGVGLVTGILAIGKHSALKDACTLPEGRCPPAQRDALASYTAMGAVSTIGVVVGAAFAAGGAILILTAPKAAPERRAWVTPMIGPGWAGAQGAF